MPKRDGKDFYKSMTSVCDREPRGGVKAVSRQVSGVMGFTVGSVEGSGWGGVVSNEGGVSSVFGTLSSLAIFGLTRDF